MVAPTSSLRVYSRCGDTPQRPFKTSLPIARTIDMKKSRPSLLKIVSAITEPAVTHVIHKLWKIIPKQKKHKSAMDAYTREPVRQAEKNDPKVIHIKPTEKVPDIKPDQPTETAKTTIIPELVPLETAIQSFLSSSKQEGCIEPFLELEIVRNSPDPEGIAKKINQALCIIRYLCKGDRIFCVGALYCIIEYIANLDDEPFTAQAALVVGASAAESEAFDMYFEHNSEERWHHIYIIHVDWKVELEDFIDWVQAAFKTLHYPYPDFLHQEEFLRLIHHQQDDCVYVWVDAINEILKPQNLFLEHIDGYDGDYHLFVLFNQIEVNVYKDMVRNIL